MRFAQANDAVLHESVKNPLCTKASNRPFERETRKFCGRLADSTACLVFGVFRKNGAFAERASPAEWCKKCEKGSIVALTDPIWHPYNTCNKPTTQRR
jgi:hypothetical protein